MICKVCKAENESQRIFCGNCGEVLPAKRHTCGFINQETDKYCGGCGIPLLNTELDNNKFIEQKNQGEQFIETFSEIDIQNILMESSEKFVSKQSALSQEEIEKLFKIK